MRRSKLEWERIERYNARLAWWCFFGTVALVALFLATRPGPATPEGRAECLRAHAVQPHQMMSVEAYESYSEVYEWCSRG